MAWQWSESAKRYRDTDTGRFLAASAVGQIRDQLIAARTAAIDRLAEDLIAERVDVAAWTKAMRDEIKTLTLAEYEFGRGGKNAMTPADRGTVGAMCRAQYEYLQKFATEVADGVLSEAKIRARARLYAGSATAAHGRGQSAAYGLRLAQHPGDGNTACLTNCRCSLRIEEDEDEWRVYWVVQHDRESCDDCVAMGDRWSPLTIAK